jgi:uncharacterized protein
MMATISLESLRRHVVTWQGFANRYLRATDDDVVECVRRLSCVQLDTISTVERSHLLVLGSRVGGVAPDTISRLLASGRLFEYWAHEACLLAVEDWPLLRRRMRERRIHHWWGPVIDSNPSLAELILNTIREHGPIRSRDFEGRGGGGMWQLKPAKRMLDALWTAGELVVSGRQGFQRLYDLPERVLPPSIFTASELSEKETIRALIMRAVSSRGALTSRGIIDHYRFDGGQARISALLPEMCSDGDIRELAVSDGGPNVFLPSECDPSKADPPVGGVLLSPFENLLWDRVFARRLFSFDHLIEVYKREHERTYGYYVLPFLVGDCLVGRADLKAHRDDALLRVKAIHLEPGVRRSKVLVACFERALERLARTLGLGV